jgi:hypothetical protein
MRLIRSTLALLAWIIIYIPTTLFVVFVMVKHYLGQRRARKQRKQEAVA